MGDEIIRGHIRKSQSLAVAGGWLFFPLIRHRLRRRLPTPSGLRPSPPDRGSRPSPARGEGLSVRLPRLLCSQASASVRAFPPVGEGGTRSVTDEGEGIGLLSRIENKIPPGGRDFMILGRCIREGPRFCSRVHSRFSQIDLNLPFQFALLCSIGR